MSPTPSLLLHCAALALVLVGCGDPSHGGAASGPPPQPPAPVPAPAAPPSPLPSAPPEQDAPVRAPNAVLRATLTLARTRVKHASELEMRVTITNGGTEPYPYSTWFLGAASLRLTARDRTGRQVPPGPPPVPREWDPAERHVIPPGGTFEIPFSGSSYFMSEPPPGPYEIRFEHSSPRAEGQDAPVETPRVKFEVLP
jgi:hypothetical protein